MADGNQFALPIDQLVGIYPQRRHAEDGLDESSGNDDDDTSELCGVAQGSLFALEELVLSPLWWGSNITLSPSSSKM